MAITSKLPLQWPPPAPRDLPFELALKMGVSAGLGLWLAHLLGLDFPVYVLLAVPTVVTTEAARSWVLAGYRLIGTLIGIGLAILVVEHSVGHAVVGRRGDGRHRLDPHGHRAA